MSYEIIIGDPNAPDESYFLGTTSDWSDFLAWVADLPGDGFAALKSFAASSATDTGTEVARQIGQALQEHPPGVIGVEKTASEVADTLFDLPAGIPAGVVS